MAEWKTVTIKKDRPCCHCNAILKKGENVEFITGRTPVFDIDGVQRGIHYFKFWAHLDFSTCDKTIEQDES